MQDQHNEFDNQGPGFVDALRQLPRPLADKFLKYAMAAIVSLILVIIMLVTTKATAYLWGFLFPVFFSYLALTIVWDWAEGRILCHKMLCIKATRQPGEQLYILLRNLDTDPDEPEQIHKFHIPISKKDAELLSLNTVLQVYYNPRNIGEMIAWEIIGNKG